MNKTRLTRRNSLYAAAGLLGACLLGGALFGRDALPLRRPGVRADGTILLPSDEIVKPAGVVRQVEGARPKDLAISPDGSLVAVAAQNRVVVFRVSDGEPVGTVTLTPAAGPLGIAWSPDGGAIYAGEASGRIAVLTREGGTWTKGREIVIDVVAAPGAPDVAAGTSGTGSRRKDPQVNGLAISPDGKQLYAALGIRNAVAIVSLPDGVVRRSVDVGVAPYHVALSPDGALLAVACRGGERKARSDEPSAPSAETPVRVDPRTDAALAGGISLIDTATGTPAVTIKAGRQPSGMVFSRDGRTLYAASSDDDSVLVVDVASRKIARTLSLRVSVGAPFGQIPTSVSLSADDATLYVACGGANQVAALDIRTRKVIRRIPTAWFPIAVAAVKDTAGGDRLVVADSKGFGSRVKLPNRGAAGAYGVVSTVGVVQFIAHDVLAAANTAVVSAPIIPEPNARRSVRALPIPERAGEPSVFKHVVYIIKENHTYDDVLGDMKEGNGDPSLCLFGEDISPNHHALARDFVLLDNVYTSGTNSADGHQWTDSAIANGYMEQNYAAHARSYPYDGGDPLAYSPQGFLWNSAIARGRSLRIYGEFVNRPRIVNRVTGKKGGTWSELWADYQKGMPSYEIDAVTDTAAIRPYLHPHYIGFPQTVPDQWRADQFIADVDRFEKDGKMPDLSIMLLPNDHTWATRPDSPTPRASVADNDLALGRIIARLSHSKFWPEMLILVIEDDSQLGLDHVDGHRTVAFCVSPYTRRNVVVHEMYNHTSFLKTIERVLDLKPMTRFDAAARPLTACFTSKADLRPYDFLPARVPLDELNPKAVALRGEARRLATASARQDWSHEDRADPETVTRAVWSSRRPGRPFPAKRYTPVGDRDD